MTPQRKTPPPLPILTECSHESPLRHNKLSARQPTNLTLTTSLFGPTLRNGDPINQYHPLKNSLVLKPEVRELTLNIIPPSNFPLQLVNPSIVLKIKLFRLDRDPEPPEKTFLPGPIA